MSKDWNVLRHAGSGEKTAAHSPGQERRPRPSRATQLLVSCDVEERTSDH